MLDASYTSPVSVAPKLPRKESRDLLLDGECMSAEFGGGIPTQVLCFVPEFYGQTRKAV